MKKMYVDLTGEKGCIGIIAHEAEVIPVGTQTHSEPEQYRDSEPAARFRRMGLHFWFGKAPIPDLYTIPQTTLLAHDGGAGRFLRTADDSIYYWDGHRVFCICDGLQSFPENWRQAMVPTDALEIYLSRREAEKVHHIYSVTELMEELQ